MGFGLFALALVHRPDAPWAPALKSFCLFRGRARSGPTRSSFNGPTSKLRR